MFGRRRLFIVDAEIMGRRGHHYSQISGFRAAARDLGLDSLVLLSAAAEPAVIQGLGARAVMPRPNPDFFGPPLAVADHLFATADLSAPLWRALEHAGIGARDLLLFAAPHPGLIQGLAGWLAGRPPRTAPATFMRLYDQVYFDRETLAYGRDAWVWRLACLALGRAPGQERVCLLSNIPALAPRVERAGARRVFSMPMPKTYDLSGGVAPALPPGDGPVVYLHVNNRCLAEETLTLVGALAALNPRPTVLAKVIAGDIGGRASAALATDLADWGAQVMTEQQSPADYLAAIAASDLTVLPYQPEAYRANPSGVLCEAAALGKPSVAAQGTWMAEQFAAGAAAGVTFDPAAPGAMAKAVLQALDNLTPLGERARALAAPFRAQNSCRRNLELMLELAQRPHDMRTPYRTGQAIDCADGFDCGAYLVSGWGLAEPGAGIWTVTDQAELLLAVDPRPAADLVLQAVVTPFLAAGHPRLTVTVLVNGREAAVWRFDIEADQDGHVRRQAPVPAAWLEGADCRISLRIDAPASPLQIGLSADSRRLGLMAHRLALEPA